MRRLTATNMNTLPGWNSPLAAQASEFEARYRVVTAVRRPSPALKRYVYCAFASNIGPLAVGSSLGRLPEGSSAIVFAVEPKQRCACVAATRGKDPQLYFQCPHLGWLASPSFPNARVGILN